MVEKHEKFSPRRHSTHTFSILKHAKFNSIPRTSRIIPVEQNSISAITDRFLEATEVWQRRTDEFSKVVLLWKVSPKQSLNG